MLGDNIFFGHGLPEHAASAPRRATKGATVFAYQVSDPERYGVVDLRRRTAARIAIEEKPQDAEVATGP